MSGLELDSLDSSYLLLFYIMIISKPLFTQPKSIDSKSEVQVSNRTMTAKQLVTPSTRCF